MFCRLLGGHSIICILFCVMTGMFGILLSGCANQGFPSGGPRDVTPPVVKLVNPANGTTKFNGHEFYIEFDEYVTIKDAENNIIVSPPMAVKPQYSVKGRGVLVKLRDTLLPGTTYLFQFKNAIADYNEGNLLPSIEYVFSTGAKLDTFSLNGLVKDAFSGHSWTEPVTVALYKANEQSTGQRGMASNSYEKVQTGGITKQVSSLGGVDDSAVVRGVPTYVTRCDSIGVFHFHYIRPGAYRLVAYADNDKNLKLGDGEAMAFSDSLVHAVYVTPPAPRDTSLPDSVARVVDSVLKARAFSQLNHQLYLSTPISTTQRLSDPVMLHKGYAELPSILPMQSPSVKSLADSIVFQLNESRDTLRVWALNDKVDSMRLVVQDVTGLQDTLKLRYHIAKNKAAGANHPGKSNVKNALSGNGQQAMLSFNTSGSMAYFDTLCLVFANPIEEVKAAKVGVTDSAARLLQLSDTNHSDKSGISTVSYINVYNVSDSTLRYWGVRMSKSGLRAVVVDSLGKAVTFRQGDKYKCLVMPNLFIDIYGHGNDSAVCSFDVSSPDKYGNLSVEVDATSWNKMDNQPSVSSLQEVADSATMFSSQSSRHIQFIIQLLDEKETVLKQQIVSGPQKVDFAHLAPGDYRVRAIEDCNNNGKWDAGNYWQHRQPEKTFLFEKTISLRANWDFNEKWQIDNK